MAWTRSAKPWLEDRTYVAPTRPSAPTLLEDEEAPIAGRIYGPKGETLKIVRYKVNKPKTKFGFTGSSQ